MSRSDILKSLLDNKLGNKLITLEKSHNAKSVIIEECKISIQGISIICIMPNSQEINENEIRPHLNKTPQPKANYTKNTIYSKSSKENKEKSKHFYNSENKIKKLDSLRINKNLKSSIQEKSISRENSFKNKLNTRNDYGSKNKLLESKNTKSLKNFSNSNSNRLNLSQEKSNKEFISKAYQNKEVIINKQLNKNSEGKFLTHNSVNLAEISNKVNHSCHLKEKQDINSHNGNNHTLKSLEKLKDENFDSKKNQNQLDLNSPFKTARMTMKNVNFVRNDYSDEFLIDSNERYSLLLPLDLKMQDQASESFLMNKSIFRCNSRKFSLSTIMDYDELFEDAWPIISSYLNEIDLIQLSRINKKYMKIILTTLSSRIALNIDSLKLVIRELEKNKNDIDEPPIFQLNKNTLKAIDILNEGNNENFFQKECVPHNDIIFPYRIFFQLLNYPNIVRLNNKEFFTECCKFFNSSKKTIGEIIKQSVSEFDLGFKNLIKLSKIVKGKEKLLIPSNYSQMSTTTGLIVFSIKDALIFSGIILEKETNFNHFIAFNKYILDLLNKDLENAQKILNQLSIYKS